MRKAGIELQKQPTPWTCVATSFAMAVGIDVKILLSIIGDGSEILWPELSGDIARKGHHVQELIDFCFEDGINIVTIEAKPIFSHYHPDAKGHKEYITDPLDYEKRLMKYLESNYGVLVGTVGFNAGHAVAWDGEKAYDPRGEIHNDLGFFNIQTFYMIK